MPLKWPIHFLVFLLWGCFFPFQVKAAKVLNTLPDSAVAIKDKAETLSAAKGKTQTVYFISGLAADERLFKNLVLPENIKVKHIVWVEPEKEEILNHYCHRLAAQIDTSSEFSLVGISFGGMIAVEMNKFIQPQKTVLVSSIVTTNGLSRFFRIVDKFKLHKAVPVWVYKHFYKAAYWFFGAQNDEQRQLIVNLMDDASPNVLKWSIDQLISWKNEFVPKHIFVMVGKRDRVFPHKRVSADTLISDGSHMMIYTRGTEISRILTKELLQ